VPAEGAVDSQRGQQRASHMVFLRKGRPKKRHKPVAGKLWRRSAIAMDLGEARCQKRADEVAHGLWSELFRQPRGVDDVAEEHRHLLHLAGEYRARLGARFMGLGW